MHINKEVLKQIGVILCIATIVITVWRALEFIMEGAITPNDVDTVIASILITSLYFNYLLLVDFDNKRPKGGGFK